MLALHGPQSLAHGKPATIPLVLGVMLGDSVAVIVSLLGLGAVLAASAELFSIVKWIGAGYLIYLGISLWRSPARTIETVDNVAGKSSRKLFTHAFIVTTFNPKGIVFFVAFLPQFVNPAFDPLVQMAILATTFVVIGTLNAALYAIFSGNLKRLLEQDRARRWFNRCGGPKSPAEMAQRCPFKREKAVRNSLRVSFHPKWRGRGDRRHRDQRQSYPY